MAKQILVLSPRRLLLLKQQGGCFGTTNLKDPLISGGQQLRVLSTWNQLCQQLKVERGFKSTPQGSSTALPLGIETLKNEEELPIEVINRRKDILDLSFEVRIGFTSCIS